MTPVRAMLAAGAAAMLCGCAALPPAAVPGSPDGSVVPPQARPGAAVSPADYERRLRERALGQGRQGRLAEAALSWEILTVLRPDSAEYRDRLAETRRVVDAALADHLRDAAQAARRSDLDAAAAHYLAALALQPDHAQAAEALRGIERERNRRSYLGKPSRITLTRRATTDAQMAAPSAALPLDRNEVEHASLLGTQGEYDDAIALLERHLALDRRDAGACRLLAEMYLHKGEKQLQRDKSGAITAFEKSVRIDPGSKAAGYLKQLRGNGHVAILPATAASGREPCGTTK